MDAPAGRAQPADEQPLPPFPEGWFFVASRREVAKAGLLRKRWMGEDIVVWCDEDGRPCVAEATCPHLGSHLGPEAGGRVRDGRLVCPFHGFEFDAAGACVATPFAAPPRSARLRVFETQEVCGLLFAWWGIGGREPHWRLPEPAPGDSRWSGMERWTVRFPGHPQETTENSVDVAHLAYVHGYSNVGGVEPVTVDGPTLGARFDFRRTGPLGRLSTLRFDVSADIEIAGLGYSFIAIREHSIGLDLRLWVLATPVDGALIDFTLVSQAKELRRPKRRIVGLGFLPAPLRAPLINKFILAQQRHDVLQDTVIWSRKRYRRRPRLCRSDGEIMTYRDYCAQFYPDPRDGDATPS